MLLATAAEMRHLDQTAIQDYSIPSIVLMENAGRTVVSAMVERYGALTGKTITILVGPGNNGGDGLVIARHLAQKKVIVHVVLMAPATKFTGDAQANLEIVQAINIPVQIVADPWEDSVMAPFIDGCFCLVDALFGTGLTREVSGRFASAIHAMNNSPAPVVAVDIPSGLHADQGDILGCSVKADMTVTFGLAKIGMALYPGRDLCGRQVVADISIPDQAVRDAALKHFMLDDTVLKKMPHRPKTGHKGTFGHVLLAAGSLGKTGAAILAAKGALRSGTGLVSMLAPEKTGIIFASSLPEVMTVPLPEPATHLSVVHYETVTKNLDGKKAVVLGPGIGTHSETKNLADRLYRECPLPMVVDADALNLLADNLQETPAAAGPRVLTPHPGEMSRLASLSTKEVQKDRIGYARDLSSRLDAVVVLKGAATVVTSPDGQVAINSSGNPAMATGGTGDVLAGLIGGLLAQGLSSWDAACLGVFGHGRAGDIAATDRTQGILATELADAIPQAMKPIV